MRMAKLVRDEENFFAGLKMGKLINCQMNLVNWGQMNGEREGEHNTENRRESWIELN
jgi:hypothetical protein